MTLGGVVSYHGHLYFTQLSQNLTLADGRLGAMPRVVDSPQNAQHRKAAKQMAMCARTRRSVQ